MHSVRRQAHRVAYSTPPGSLNYNPFARQRSRDVPVDTTEPPHNASTTLTPIETHDVTEKKSDAPPAERTDEEDPDIAPDEMRPDEPASLHESLKWRLQPSRRSSRSFPGTRNYPVLAPRVTPKTQLEKPRKDEAIDGPLTRVDSDALSMEERRQRSLKRKIPIGAQVRTILVYNYVSTILVPCIPAGFAVNYVHSNAIAVFYINFAAIIPSATILSAALNDLHIRSGEKVSALLNQTFGNAVQLILSILLLKSRQVSVLKLSLLGTILSSLLLTTGLSFLLGGWKRLEQYFNVSLAQMISMLLLLAVSSLIIPSGAHLMTNTTAEGILAESRGISVVILISYVLWLFFTLSTHRVMFSAPAMKAQERPHRPIEKGEAFRGLAAIGAGNAAASGGRVHTSRILVNPGEELEEFETPSLSLTGAIVALVFSVVLLAFNTQFATDSIQAILQRRKVSQTFLSLIILPILSNDPMAINMAIQDKMDMSISLALERCMQTCLLVVPLTVLLAWCMGVNDMNLDFDGFSIATLFVSIIIVTYVVQEGKSNWLTGALLIKVFIIIALAAFYIP